MAMKRYKIKNMTYIGCIIFLILLMLTVNNINGSQQMRQTAENIMSWQLENGGWTKDNPDIFTRTWDGKEKKPSTISRMELHHLEQLIMVRQ